MKKVCTLIVFILAFLQAKSQYVSIPDANFAKFLRINYPSAMSGSLLDTTNIAITNATSLNCSYYLIANLYGVQFFDNLNTFDCTGNPVSFFPVFPPSVKKINCGQCSLSSLPALPDSLVELDCSENMLVSLPSLPATLRVLHCYNNALTSLLSLPDLTTLLCQENKLTSISGLPSTLRYFACSNNNLTSLPKLPSGIEQFNCSYNRLTSLPKLPDSLVSFICAENALSTLPILPNALVELNCSSNNLSGIPNIPGSLKSFYCWDNPDLHCLPPFSNDSFFEFGVMKNTGISCLPKVISISWSSDSSAYLPVCSTTSGCAVVYNIIGNVHEDTSVSCVLDSLHNGVALKYIKLKGYKNGVLYHQTYVGANGYYSFDADISDSVDVFVDTVGLPFKMSCPNIGRRSAKLTLSDSMFYNQDFGIECKGVDLGIGAIYGVFRKGATRPLMVRAGDLSRMYHLNCAVGTGGTVTTTITGTASYVAPFIGALTPSSVSGGVLTYYVADFGAIDMASAFNIYVYTDSAAALGSDICIHTVISASVPDVNRANDTLLYCGKVVNSCDPNEKLVYPATTIAPDEWLTYTINFQNTGTDTAYHIVVKDTLDRYLDPETFTYLASSHNTQIDIFGNVIMFNFARINLPDSLHNEPESHGWVQYKIKPLSSLPLSVTIKNTAYVYFDDNAAVVTNTTSNTYHSLNIIPVDSKADFKLYPNPTSACVEIETTERGTFRLLNLWGSELYRCAITNSITKLCLSEIENGLYIFQFTSTKSANAMGKLLLHR